MHASKFVLAASLVLFPVLAPAAAKESPGPFFGKWDLTITTPDGKSYPSWAHILQDGNSATGEMVGRTGSVFPVLDVVIDKGTLSWKTFTGKEPNRIATEYKATLKGKKLAGTVTIGDQPPLTLAGVRAPVWKVGKGDAAKKKLGKPVPLFNGKDLGGWVAQNKDAPIGWIVKDGVMDNQGKANNIYSDAKFTDFKLEVEFNIAAHSNSGVYLRGRDEIQILDDFGKPPESHGQGGLYGFITPSTNASKPAGEWQTLEALLAGNRVTVILNGTKIIDDEEIPGITGGALDSDEGKPGPVLLQGDHGPVQYRKVVVTPLK